LSRFLVKRLLHTVIILLGVSVVTFFLLYLTGDPVSLFVPFDATPEAVEALREAMGFNDPLWVQYLRFFRGMIQGDFGVSLRHRVPALPLVLERLPVTFELTFLGMGLAVALAVPFGVVSAARRYSFWDNAASILGLLGQSVPVFYLGLMLILIFAVKYRLFPANGWDSWRHMVLPAITVGTYSMALIMRLLRSQLLEVLQQDYVKTARAKGLAERVVIYKHALRNALLPVVTVVGLQVGVLLGGAVITETIFAIPGLGRFLIQGIYNRDMPVVQSGVFIFSLSIVAVNLLTDVVYTLLDPRITYD